MRELVERIWNNGRFHEAAARAHRSWLARELGKPLAAEIDMDDAVRLMQAAAVLACSEDHEHRRAAYRSATTVYEVVGTGKLPMQQALRVVLGRLGNFPALETRQDVSRAGADLPLELAVEELAASDGRRVLLRDRPVLLTTFQHDLWTKLGAGRSVAVGAPTSAGKSFVLQGHLARTFEDEGDRVVVYLVPTRALIAQVARDLAGVLSSTEHAPEILTVPSDADTLIPRRAVLVMTQERVQLMLAAHPKMTAAVVIVDEAHSIADSGRGILLQWVVDELIRRAPDAQLLFAGPGIRNLEVFGRTFGLPHVEEVPSSEPTVAQNFLIVRVTSATQGHFSVSSVEPGHPETPVMDFEIGATLASRTDRLVQISAALGKDAPSIVYANGAAEAEKFALQLADLMSHREATPRREAVAQLARESVHGSYVLARTVLRGIGFHYSYMPTQVRQAVEDAFAEGAVDFLVCTSTLLQGVNLPARNVFMCKPEKGRTHPLEGADFWNLAGRAGRLRREFHGNIFLIDYDDWRTKPLDQPRQGDVVPALQSELSGRLDELVARIQGTETEGRAQDVALDTLFVRLLDDRSRGELPRTLTRLTGAGLPQTTVDRVSAALDGAVEALTLPVGIVRQSPSLSPHRQQSLHSALMAAAGSDKAGARALVPAHPREPGAHASHSAMLRRCHTHLLGLPQEDRRHAYHALQSLFWMRGDPLPRIVDNALARAAGGNTRKVVRDALETIERVIRFEVVRLVTCYCAVLGRVFEELGHAELSRSIPTLPLYLEVGASDKSMVSFMALGLSRVTAAKVNDATANKGMTPEQARSWLASVPIDEMDLSPLLVDEIRRLRS